MKAKTNIGLVYLLLAFCFCRGLVADEAMVPGALQKLSLMPSASLCEGATCVVSNPSLLNHYDIGGAYGELGWVQIYQSYEHPNFDPVKITVRTPIASLGYVYQYQTWGLGIVAFPTGLGKQTINGLPRRIAGSMESLYVENESLAYEIAVGGAWQAIPKVLSLGLGVARKYEKRKIFATRVQESTPLIRYSGYNTFYVPYFGMTWEIAEHWRFAANYRFAKVKTYKGKQKSATSDEETKPQNRNFEPALLSMSLTWHEQLWLANLDVNHYFYNAGRNEYAEGLTSSSQHADLDSVTDVSIKVGTKFNLGQRGVDCGIAAARSRSPWGDGHYSNVEAEMSSGVDIGALNNVNRSTYGLYGRTSLGEDLIANASIYHSFGRREVGPSGDRPGYYQTEVTGFDFSVQYKF